MTRNLKLAYWGFAPLVALVLYWPGLTAWFQKDDFAWLGLRDLVHSWRDLLWALFAPMAQGTVRTLSERVYFLSFTSLFGLHPLPFRIWGLLTGFVTLAMLTLVTSKLTRSRAAGWWAALFWITNSTTAYVFSWTAIYYEVLCALFLLTSLWLLIRYAETGIRRYYAAQWTTYLLGFLVLELNVVYPVLALVYAWCCARGIMRKVLPLFIPAAIYSVWHLVTAPLQTGGPYKMFWNAQIVPTFWTYWKSALGPNRLIYAGIPASALRSALAASLMLGLFGYLLWCIRKRHWLTVFLASWFVIVLAPLLPLRDHISDYYLTIPTLGLAMWGSQALIAGWRANVLSRAVAVSLAAIYLAVNIPVAHITTQAFHQNSHRIERLVERTADACRAHPGKMIVLQGIKTPEFFFDAVWNRPFRLYGCNAVYLITEDAPDVVRALSAGDVPQFFVTEETAKREQAVVVEWSAAVLTFTIR